METRRRDQIARSLRSLAEIYSATITLLCEELALDPLAYLHVQPRKGTPASRPLLIVDRTLLAVIFRGQQCFLGNTLPFKLISRLAERPNTYVTYDDLLTEVWQGIRSDGAIRSVVKTLRGKLREAGLGTLADAIDGNVPGHYILKLAK